MITKPNLAQLGMPLLAASTFVLPFATSSAGALVTIGDHATLFFNGSAAVQANDNIFLDANNEESDLLFIFAPGLELNIGSRANANVNIWYREDFHRYSDNSVLNSNYSNVFLESHFNQPRLELRLNVSYQQLAQPTPEVVQFAGQLVERDVTNATLRAEYDVGERTTVSTALETTFRRFQTNGFVDADTYAVPINVYYALTPLLDLSLGYRYRYTDMGTRQPILGPGVFGPGVSVPDYRDHFLNFGARGELAPKLIGHARLGYQEREVGGAEGNVSGLSFKLDFSHYTTPRTTLIAGAYRDFGVGGRGASVTSIGGRLGVNHAFSHLISGQAGLNYYERDWDRNVSAGQQNRKDETLDLNLGATYSPNMYVDLSAGYVFRTNSSNLNAFEFDNNIFSLSAALRY